jgi:arginyl-tRNA synthetase
MQGRELTLAHFEKIYRMLETQFDHYFFESEVWHSGEALVHEGLAHGVFEESEGAVVFRGEKFGLHTRVFITREGLPTYEAKDLGLALAKLAYVPFDLSITTTAVEQKEYFKVVFEALAQLRPDLRGKFTSITHGMMRFASGKMSSRKGNVITGESLLRDLIDASKEKIGSRELKDADTVAEQVAVGAIKYAILKQGSGKDIVFDPEKSLSLEGDSGPYLQYAHTRAVSLLKMAKEANIVPAIEGAGGLPAAASPRSPAAQAGNPPAPISRETLERTLIHFPGVLERAADELEPHHVTTYLTELASAFNAWYASERVIGSETQEWGICLTRAFANTMRRGLEALGIPVPEEM